MEVLQIAEKTTPAHYDPTYAENYKEHRYNMLADILDEYLCEQDNGGFKALSNDIKQFVELTTPYHQECLDNLNKIRELTAD